MTPKAINDLTVEYESPTTSHRIGLIAMHVDESTERGFRNLMPDGVSVFTTRARVDLEAFECGKFRVEGGFEKVADTLPPYGRLDLIAFSCTSGAAICRPAEIADGFSKSQPNIPVIDPATSSIRALLKAGHAKVSLLTPYSIAAHNRMVSFFENNGLEISHHGTFECEDDSLLPSVTTSSLFEAASKLIQDDDAEALLICCTGLDIVDSMSSMASMLGVSVFSSAQLFAYEALSVLGLPSAAEVLSLGASKQH